ncbi:hypothetical protein [Nostoc sp.]|uniref:hypothetical protein n=1 Tax=Nostoc sp. TaxID=1180 RepID=UPI002FF7CE37
MKYPTPHFWVCDSLLTPHSLETVGRVLWTQPATVASFPPFRLLCQVAHAVSAIAITIHQAVLNL